MFLVRKHQLDADRIRSLQQKIKSFRKIIFPISILAYLLIDRYRYTIEELFSKGNYMKLFAKKNSKFIEGLISNERPEQFPLEQKVRLNLKTNPHENDKLVGDYLGQNYSSQRLQTRPIVVFMIRVPRNNNRQNQFERRRYTNRIHQSSQQINNEATLKLISNLPPQQIENNPFANQFFNGSSF
ncbi:hypothetical protein GLOIN_2v1471937 [Rhizophagus irregularis DAOM 181602=DAOM 197198]|nr:hypothetical protein GLOIN_2v1471937 [Rhizophagus irregularis DAOM 181602=DAOM 197198]